MGELAPGEPKEDPQSRLRGKPYLVSWISTRKKGHKMPKLFQETAAERWVRETEEVYLLAMDTVRSLRWRCRGEVEKSQRREEAKTIVRASKQVAKKSRSALIREI